MEKVIFYCYFVYIFCLFMLLLLLLLLCGCPQRNLFPHHLYHNFRLAVYGVEREAANAKMLLIKIIINIGVGKEGEKNMKKIKIYENYT